MAISGEITASGCYNPQFPNGFRYALALAGVLATGKPHHQDGWFCPAFLCGDSSAGENGMLDQMELLTDL